MSTDKPFSYSAILAKSMGKPSLSPPPPSSSPSLSASSASSAVHASATASTSDSHGSTMAPSPRRPIRFQNQQPSHVSPATTTNRNRGHAPNSTPNSSQNTTMPAVSSTSSSPSSQLISASQTSPTTTSTSSSSSTSSSPARSSSPSVSSDIPVVSAWTRPLPSLMKPTPSASIVVSASQSPSSTAPTIPSNISQAARKPGRASPPAAFGQVSSNNAFVSVASVPASKAEHSEPSSHSINHTDYTPIAPKPLSYLAAVDPTKQGAASPTGTTHQRVHDINGASSARSPSPSASSPVKNAASPDDSSDPSLSRNSSGTLFSNADGNLPNAQLKKKKSKKTKKKSNEGDYRNFDETHAETGVNSHGESQKEQDSPITNGNMPQNTKPYSYENSPVQSATTRFQNMRFQHPQNNTYLQHDQSYPQTGDAYGQNQYYPQHQHHLTGSNVIGSPGTTFRTNRRGGNHGNQRPNMGYHPNPHQHHDRNSGGVRLPGPGNPHVPATRGSHRGGTQYRRGRGGYHYNMWPYMQGGEEMLPSMDGSNEGIYSDPNMQMPLPMSSYMPMNMSGYPPSNIIPLSMHPSGSPVIAPINPNSTGGLPVGGVTSPTRKDEIRRQIEYYFSVENLARDTYLRGLMGPRGYVLIENLLTFPRIRQLTENVDELTVAARSSNALKVKNGCLRLRSEWQTWVYPPPQGDDESSDEETGKEDDISNFDNQTGTINEMVSGSMPHSMHPYSYYLYPQYIPYTYQNPMMGMGMNMLQEQPYMMPHQQPGYASHASADGKKYSQRKRQPMNHRNPTHHHTQHSSMPYHPDTVATSPPVSSLSFSPSQQSASSSIAPIEISAASSLSSPNDVNSQTSAQL